MRIISHRGFWKTPSEKNTVVAFQRSFDLGFGLETDLRDHMGQLVISHDIVNNGEISFSNLLSLSEKYKLLLALNIKSDGLAKLVSKAMIGYDRKNWFVFDMSIPDTLDHLSEGNPVFARMSEVEKTPVWFEQIDGIWLDSFDNQWYDLTLISDLLNKGKQVCVVSPELHGREYIGLWTMLLPLAKEHRLILCTDFPVKATEHFLKGI